MIDELKEFRFMNTKNFFQNQTIYDRKNRIKFTEHNTKIFHNAFNFLVEQNYDSAKKEIKRINRKGRG